MKLSTVAITLTLAVSGAAQAQGLNPNGPLSVASDQLTNDPDNCTQRLTGRVELTRDRMRLRAESVVTQAGRRNGGCGSIRQIDARGTVYYVTPERSVRADQATYNLENQNVVFTGNVVAVQGQDVTTADSMTINTETDALQLNGRVRAVVYSLDDGGPAQ